MVTLRQFRVDYYANFLLSDATDIDSTSKTVVEVLKSRIGDIEVTRVSTDKGEWSEISGKLGFAKGTISFYATLKPKDEHADYDMFMRIDGFYEADTPEGADKIARAAIEEMLLKPMKDAAIVKQAILDRPEKLVKGRAAD